MDGVPGVDVSWLHHNSALKDQRKPVSKASSKHSSTTSSRAPSPPRDTSAKPQTRPQSPAAAPSPARPQDATATGPSTAPIPISQARPSQKRAPLPPRSSADRLSGSSVGSSPEETKTSSRSGWIRSLSSKFSSQEKTPTLSQGYSSPSQSSLAPPRSPQQQLSPSLDKSTNVDPDSQVQQQPKPSSSFFSSALRRLSSSNTQAAAGKAPAVQVASSCPRRLLNVDKSRTRSQVPGLKDSRLRRVAFSVDVEVAGVSRYIEEPENAEPAQKSKDKRLQARSEGEALKNPKLSVEKKETASSIVRGANDNRQAPAANVDDLLEKEMLAAAKRQEQQESVLRKRLEQEDKRRRKDDDGRTPSLTDIPDGRASRSDSDRRLPISYPEDRPTTDPLRIYRRCCQLREAPVLKRISEQLANMKSEVEKTGFVPKLDLNGSRLQLQDIGCLGDWLAVVPVKKLSMDAANLNDESLRIVLAGLLATRPPEKPRDRGPRSSPTRRKEHNARKHHGVIEKLSLRSNHKITAEGWRHFCLFLNLCPSLRAVDISLTPLPHSEGPQAPTDTASNESVDIDIAALIHTALTTRSDKSSRIEELIVSECKLTTGDVAKIVDAACEAKVEKLGLAKNNLDEEALVHVKRFLSTEDCGGLDLGGNNLRNRLPSLVQAINGKSRLWALCLADCNLDAASIANLFPALLQPPDFRVVVLSHNRDLFTSASKPSAVDILRKYLPLCTRLRRLDLTDTALSSQQAIMIAEILPDVRNLNHLGIGENTEIRKLANAIDPASQEEACALYGSLMVAVRISKTLLAVDVEVPSKDTSEIVQALAKQVVAYAFRNVERFTSVDAINNADPASLISDALDTGKDVPVPEVLSHLIGITEDEQDQPQELDIHRDHDYIVGGTGVVKALSYVLGQKSSDFRRMSGHFSGSNSPTLPGTPASESQSAREMTRNLLSSARKIRARLQLTMAREGSAGDELSIRRLQFLDHTLEHMIERFEETYPDCVLPKNEVVLQYPFRHHTTTDTTEAGEALALPDADGSEVIDLEQEATSARSRASSAASSIPSAASAGSALSAGIASAGSVPEDFIPALQSSRRGSTASLAAKAQAHEEGRMHRFGQRFRREILPPKGVDDYYHRTSRTDPAEAPHLAELRSKVEAMGGQEIREKVIRNGLEKTVREYSEEAERLRRHSMPIFDDFDVSTIRTE